MPENLSEQSPEEIKSQALMNLNEAISLFSLEVAYANQPEIFKVLNALVAFAGKIDAEQPLQLGHGVSTHKAFLIICSQSTSNGLFERMKGTLPQLVFHHLQYAKEEGVSVDIESDEFMETVVFMLIAPNLMPR